MSIGLSTTLRQKPIRVFNSAQVSVRGNRIEDRRELVPGAIVVAADCGPVDVRDNTLVRNP